VVVNETGIPYTGTFSTADVTGSSATDRAAFYDRIAALGDYGTQSVCTWSIAPNRISNRSNDYGLFDEDFVARTELTSRFQELPYTASVSGRSSSVFAGTVR
jgi:hypothetical protein